MTTSVDVLLTAPPSRWRVGAHHLAQRLAVAWELAAGWAVVLALGVFALAVLVQAALTAQTRAVETAQGARLLRELVTRLELDIAAGDALDRQGDVQRHLEEALTTAGADLHALDLVAVDGQVLVSTEPSAVGDRVDGGQLAEGAEVQDAAGMPVGRLLARMAPAARGALEPVRGAARWAIGLALAAWLVTALWAGSVGPVADLPRARERLVAACQRQCNVTAELRENRSEKTVALQ